MKKRSAAQIIIEILTHLTLSSDIETHIMQKVNISWCAWKAYYAHLTKQNLIRTTRVNRHKTIFITTRGKDLITNIKTCKPYYDALKIFD